MCYGCLGARKTTSFQRSKPIFLCASHGINFRSIGERFGIKLLFALKVLLHRRIKVLLVLLLLMFVVMLLVLLLLVLRLIFLPQCGLSIPLYFGFLFRRKRGHRYGKASHRERAAN